MLHDASLDLGYTAQLKNILYFGVPLGSQNMPPSAILSSRPLICPWPVIREERVCRIFNRNSVPPFFTEICRANMSFMKFRCSVNVSFVKTGTMAAKLHLGVNKKKISGVFYISRPIWTKSGQIPHRHARLPSVCKFRPNRYNESHNLFTGINEILPAFLHLVANLDSIQSIPFSFHTFFC